MTSLKLVTNSVQIIAIYCIINFSTTYNLTQNVNVRTMCKKLITFKLFRSSMSASKMKIKVASLRNNRGY